MCYGHIVLTTTTTKQNIEVRIFKLCHKIIVFQHTGVQQMQKAHLSTPKSWVGRSAHKHTFIHITIQIIYRIPHCVSASQVSKKKYTKYLFLNL